MDEYRGDKKNHVYKDRDNIQRATVSLDNCVWQLLALNLGSVPDGVEGHKSVRQWLQTKLDEDVDPDRVNTSQWLQQNAVLEIADKKLSEKYWDWKLGGNPRSRKKHDSS